MITNKNLSIYCVSSQLTVIGIINDILLIKYSYFSFLHILHIWQETACNTQIASQIHIAESYVRGHDADIFLEGN